MRLGLGASGEASRREGQYLGYTYVFGSRLVLVRVRIATAKTPGNTSRKAVF